MRDLKIINLVEEGKLGGPQLRMLLVAKALKGQVETLIVMPNSNSDEFQKRCNQLGIGFLLLPLTRITKEFTVAVRYLVCFPIEIWTLVRHFQKVQFDLVHVSGGAWQFKAVIAAKLAGYPVVWHLNDTCMPAFIRWVFRWLSSLSDGYIFASDRSKTYYSPLIRGAKPTYIIPAPVDTDHFAEGATFSTDAPEISQWSGRIVVGTIANVSPIKGLNDFVGVAAILAKKQSTVHFVVIGPVYQNQRRYYRQLMEECKRLGLTNIEFLGGRRDPRPLLSRFDIYLCTSLAESSPMAVWEAMSMGKPIVSTDVGDVALYVREENLGIVRPVGDVEGLAAGVEFLAKSSELRADMGQRARKIATGCFDIAGCAKKHLSVYREIAGQSRGK